ncbi:MAG: hypothetical protein Hyperionvirus11_2 [Hyperionvirus sp.]|uniref:Uncharacterized protein n=1 Tax=Hyperionvirus sp. TaxID=2487770 RepID=A0A3G5AED3_9VIRU|nr:MAG: hypothetical protein Hyperionvirus11_2 [Hyperionvirus sp.]
MFQYVFQEKIEIADILESFLEPIYFRRFIPMNKLGTAEAPWQKVVSKSRWKLPERPPRKHRPKAKKPVPAEVVEPPKEVKREPIVVPEWQIVGSCRGHRSTVSKATETKAVPEPVAEPVAAEKAVEKPPVLSDYDEKFKVWRLYPGYSPVVTCSTDNWQFYTCGSSECVCTKPTLPKATTPFDFGEEIKVQRFHDQRLLQKAVQNALQEAVREKLQEIDVPSDYDEKSKVWRLRDTTWLTCSTDNFEFFTCGGSQCKCTIATNDDE